MATTETVAAHYRVTGRDEDDKDAARIADTRGRAGAHNIQVWHDRQGQHQEHEENQVQDAGGQGSAGREDKENAEATSGCNKTGQHRQSPRTKAAMTQKDGEPHKVDYTRVGFETPHFLLTRYWRIIQRT